MDVDDEVVKVLNALDKLYRKNNIIRDYIKHRLGRLQAEALKSVDVAIYIAKDMVK